MSNTASKTGRLAGAWPVMPNHKDTINCSGGKQGVRTFTHKLNLILLHLPTASLLLFQNSLLLLFALFPTPHLSSGWLHYVFGRGLCRVQYLATAPFSQSASPWWAPSRPHGNRRPSLITLFHCHSAHGLFHWHS